jgi:hypothetical protein
MAPSVNDFEASKTSDKSMSRVLNYWNGFRPRQLCGIFPLLSLRAKISVWTTRPGAAFLAGAPAGGDFIGKWISIMAPAAEFLAEDTRDAAARQQALEFASVRRSIDNLGTFPFVRTRAAERAVALHGAWFDIATGALMVLDQATGRFAAAAVGSG